ncbi:MAG TPA: sensor histidine kinase, partial [Bordetella sp.]|nr:sensor histidine kinase [Bordetella sp.]
MALSDHTSTIFSSISRELSQGESSPGFWRAQVVGWIFLAVVGFFIRLAVFGNASAAFWLTLALEPLAFGLTSAAAVWHGRNTSKTRSPISTLACAVLLCVAAAALLA